MFTLIERLTKLIEAIQALTVSASASSRANATGCGCPGGSDPPSEPATEGGDPPDGWEDSGLTGEDYTNRKCIVSNLIHQQIREATNKLLAAGVDDIVDYTPQVGSGTLISWIIAALSNITFFYITTIINFAATLVKVILENTVDLANVITVMDANEDDLVCALYSSISVGSARTNYIQVLADNGASYPVQLYLDFWLSWNDILNMLFFDPNNEPANSALEGAISSYAGGVDCSACEVCPVIYPVISDWSAWSSVDHSTNSGSSTGTITDKLAYTTTIAASPSGNSIAQRRFVVPLSEVYAAGWVPEIGATIAIEVDGDGPVIVGHGVLVNYVTDPQQSGANVVLANANGQGVLALNSNDTIASIEIYATNQRTSGSSTLNNSGQFTSVTFCNA